MRGDTLRRYLQTSFAKCICASCEREDCQLRLDSLFSHYLIIIDADKYKKCRNFRGRVCDYILFYLKGGATVAVVELKSGSVKAEIAQKQIENGAKIAEQIMGKHQASDFLPIVLHGKGISRLDIRMLRGVFFQGKKHKIIIERCGSQLGEILSR